MSGPNLNHDTGYAEYGTTSNLDLVVIADEVLGMARRVTAGVEVSDDTLDLDEIEKVGPGGSFKPIELDADLNDLFADDDEDYKPKDPRADYKTRLVDRAARGIWEKAGSKTLTQVANEKVRDIINYHEPAPLERELAAKIRDIVENAVGHMPGEEAE
jgi:trimethylamine--corrinoid protein Co-methyltransferase